MTTVSDRRAKLVRGITVTRIKEAFRTTRSDTLLATYKGLINTVCRPAHLGQMQITRGLASVASEQEGMTNRERAAWMFCALVGILEDEGALGSDDAASYISAARDWAFSCEDVGDLSVLMTQL